MANRLTYSIANGMQVKRDAPATRTAVISRVHMYGTHRYYLSLMHRGYQIGPREPQLLPGHWAPFELVQDDAAGMQRMRDHAKRLGFTHVRIAGDWQGRTVPKGGAL